LQDDRKEITSFFPHSHPLSAGVSGTSDDGGVARHVWLSRGESRLRLRGPTRVRYRSR
jgi:hypothetical protein